MEQTIARSDRLEAQLAAMETAGPLKRLTLMATEIDPVIAGRTLHAFELATPLTVEALMTAGAEGCWGGRRLYRRLAVAPPIPSSGASRGDGVTPAPLAGPEGPAERRPIVAPRGD